MCRAVASLIREMAFWTPVACGAPEPFSSAAAGTTNAASTAQASADSFVKRIEHLLIESAANDILIRWNSAEGKCRNAKKARRSALSEQAFSQARVRRAGAQPDAEQRPGEVGAGHGALGNAPDLDLDAGTRAVGEGQDPALRHVGDPRLERRDP